MASLASLAAGLAAVVVLGWQFGTGDVVTALRRADLLLLPASVAAGAMVRLGYALRWRASAVVLGVRASLPRLVRARLAGDALGAVLPAGRISGDPLRAALLCAEGQRAATAATSVALDRFMEWIGNTACAVGCVTIFVLSRAATERTVWILLLGMVALLGALVTPLLLLRRGQRPFQLLHRLTPRLSWPRLRRWLGLLHETETQLIGFFRDHQRVFTAGAAVSLLIEAVILVEYRMFFSAFGIALDWPTLMIVVVTGGLARCVPIPAGVGALEASQVGLLAVTAGDAGLGFLVGIVIRLHEVLWTLLGFAALVAGGHIERLKLNVTAGKGTA